MGLEEEDEGGGTMSSRAGGEKSLDGGRDATVPFSLGRAADPDSFYPQRKVLSGLALLSILYTFWKMIWGCYLERKRHRNVLFIHSKKYKCLLCQAPVLGAGNVLHLLVQAHNSLL